MKIRTIETKTRVYTCDRCSKEVVITVERINGETKESDAVIYGIEFTSYHDTGCVSQVCKECYGLFLEAKKNYFNTK